MGLADRLVRTFGLRGLVLLMVLTPVVVKLQGRVLRRSATWLAASEAVRWVDPAARAFEKGDRATQEFLLQGRRGGVIGGWLEVDDGPTAWRYALPEYEVAVRSLDAPKERLTLAWSQALQTTVFLLRFPLDREETHWVVLVREFGRESQHIDLAQGLTTVLLIFSLYILYVGLHFLAEKVARELEAERQQVERYARELEEIQDHLIRTSRLTQLGELTASVAHEVKNPLASLSMGLQVLRTKIPEEGSCREDVERLLEATGRLDGVVQSMLRFSRPGGAGSGPVDLVGVVDKVLMLLSRELKDRGLRLEVERPEEKVVVQGDPVQIEQVVLNLLVNARDASSEGGEIRVRIRRGEGAQGVVEIVDRGVGLGGSDPEGFFEAFHTTKGSEGTGLGLSISRRIARAHGGEVRIQERDGEVGVVATLVLPELREDAS